MAENQATNRKVFKSFEEYEMEYYPKAWEEKSKIHETEKCETCGTGLVPEIFNTILKNVKAGRKLKKE